MFGRGGRAGGGGGRQVCHFFLEGRCRFGGTLEPISECLLCVWKTDAKQTTARMNIPPGRATLKAREALATSLPRSITVKAQEIDQAALDQVRSFLPFCPRLLRVLAVSQVRAPASTCTFKHLIVANNRRRHPVKINVYAPRCLRYYQNRSHQASDSSPPLKHRRCNGALTFVHEFR